MDELDEGFVNPLDSPELANAQIKAVLAGAQKAETPVIPLPPADVVTLPGGLVKAGEVIRTVVVRELTGEHEEALAKASQSANWAHFLTVLLECGTARVGDADPRKTTDLLKDMYVGDRDQVLFGIRQATYGDEIDIPGWTCPTCQKQSDLTLSLADDIDTVKLTDPRRDGVFTVPLRRGRSATVRLATGRDQLAVFDKDDLTPAERDSILLSRCVTALTEADGTALVTAGLGASIALGLSIPDRKAILRELVKRQPGPRYNEVKFTHQSCGEEVPLSLGLGDLFPDL